LRTALHFAANNGDYQTILITSGVPGEGKSFCAINYAIALAQQGFSTLLIDADLRLPSVGGVFSCGKEIPGLSEVLEGACPLAEAAQLTTIANLSVMTAGARVANPGELVTSAQFAGILREARERFDRVVIDTAPVHAVAETLLMAPQADVVCLVVRAASTQANVAARAVEVLRQSGAKIPGFILNGLPVRHGGYYYHYHAPGYGGDEVYGASAALRG